MVEPGKLDLAQIEVELLLHCVREQIMGLDQKGIGRSILRQNKRRMRTQAHGSPAPRRDGRSTEARMGVDTALCPTCRLPLSAAARTVIAARSQDEATCWECEACGMPAWSWDWDDPDPAE